MSSSPGPRVAAPEPAFALRDLDGDRITYAQRRWRTPDSRDASEATDKYQTAARSLIRSRFAGIPAAMPRLPELNEQQEPGTVLRTALRSRGRSSMEDPAPRPGRLASQRRYGRDGDGGSVVGV